MEQEIHNKIADLIIIGAGCTGLAIAREMVEQKSSKEVLLLESRDRYSNDRTWCYWEKTNSFWADFANYYWDSWKYSDLNTQKSIIHRSSAYNYYCLNSLKYYHYHFELINQSPLIKLLMGDKYGVSGHHAVKQVKNAKRDYWEVKTKDGNIYRSYEMIDTRNPQVFEADMYQCFYGVEIETPSLSDNFVCLMTDLRSDIFGLRFNYILPLGKHRYLFEHTRFAPDNISTEQIKKECFDEIRRLDITIDSLIRSESATLPMGLRESQKKWPIAGTSDGALRSSTGYGFLRIQKWAKHFVQRFLSKDQSQLRKLQYGRSIIDDLMDKVFLHALKHHQDKTSDFFMKLAENCSPDSLVRFLSDHSTTLDYFRIIKSLPPKPFLWSTYKLLTKKRA